MGETIINPDIKKTFPWKLAVIFILFSGTIIIMGIYYYRYEKNRIFEEQEKNLSAIASLKIKQISQWYSDKLSDAAVIKNNEPLVSRITQFFNDENQTGIKKEIKIWLEALNTQYDYNSVALLDTLLRVKIATSNADPLADDSIRKELNNVIRYHKIILTDLHKTGTSQTIRMDLLVPLFDSLSNKQKTIGLIILSIDPDKILYPLVQSWPTSSKSSETLILRREGDSVVYLNELRHRKNTALSLKFPLSKENLLASKAVNGFEGVTEGTDYRDIPAIGALSKIPGLPWYMVAKTDKNEVLEQFKRYSVITVVVIILLIIMNFLVFGYWVWAQYLKIYRLQLNDEISLRKSEELLNKQYYTLKGIVESSGGPIFSLDRNYCYTSFNKNHALTMKSLYGADIETGKSMLDYQTNNDDKIKAKENIDRALSGENIEKGEWSGDDPDTRRFFEVIHNPIINDKDEVIGVAINARDLTDRKNAEEKLKQSEVTLQSIIDNSNSLIYLIDTEGRFVLVNQHLQNLLSLSRELLIGQTREAFLPKVIADMHRKNDLEVMKTGKTQVFEEENIEADGTHFYLTTKFPLYNSHNEIYAVGGLSTDITERKKIEDELKESEEKFRKAFFTNPDSVTITRLDNGTYVSVNDGFTDTFEYSEEEVIGKTPFDISIWHNIDERNLFINVLKAEGKVRNFETKFYTKSRKIIDCLISATTISFDGVDHVLSNTRDITYRKDAELALLDSEERFRSLYENATIGIYRTTLSGKILMANPAMVSMLGFDTFEQLSQRNLQEEGYEPDYPRSKFLESIERDGRIIGLESAWNQKNGNTLIVRESANAVRDAKGRILFYDGTVEDITERKKIEEALRENERRLREAQDLAHLGFWLWDIKTGNVEWSDEVFKIFCLDPSTFKPQIDSILKLSPWPEENQRDKELINRAIESHSPGTYEQRFLRPDMSIGYYYSTFRGNYDNKGNLLSIVGTILDMTERKKKEEILRESETKFMRLIKFAPLPLCYIDKDGLISLRNDRFIKVFGYDETEVPGLREWWLKAYPDPEYRKRVVKNWNDAVVKATKNSTDIQSDEYLVTCKDGSVHTIIISGITIGENLLATFIDITERKEAEESLRESEERFRIMANSIPQLAWVARADGFIYWYNQRWYEYTGTKPEQMEGWGWQRVHDPEVLPNVVEKWSAAIASGQSFEMSFPLRGADGQFRTFLTRVEPWKDSEGRVMQWFGTNTDVETLKQAEEKIRLLNSELDKRVNERTSSLEAANKELEAFSYSVSHDLRAPLRSVHGFTKILLEDYESKLDDEGKRICEIISSSATQMGELIDDLLSFSRIGRSTLNPSVIDMKKMVGMIFENMTSTSERERINFNIGKIPKAFGDFALFGQVWTNLISNAIKYTSKNDVSEVIIGSKTDRKMITYFIKDNGVGFEMQYAHKLFGVFQRLHSDSDFEGNGVGLAIVRSIVQKHGGKAWAEGEVGKGATFYFSLPAEGDGQQATGDRKTGGPMPDARHPIPGANT